MSVGLPSRFNITKLAPILEDVHERLAGVVIESLRWQAFLDRYDRPGTLFYLDPPYWGSEGDYGAGMFGQDEFAQMADRLKALKGRFILSINDRPEVRETFVGIERIEVDTTYTIQAAKSQPARELIFVG